MHTHQQNAKVAGMQKEYQAAFKEWGELLGDESALQHNEKNAKDDGERVSVAGKLYPESTEEIIAAVMIADRYNIPLYPISTGRNWGYGGASPVADGCVIMDLSRMNTIIDFDEDLGLVTVEPGVTFGQLSDYIREKELHYMIPVVGSGLHCSLIGNLLEKGHSDTVYVDRCASLMSLEAVLADGSVYSSSHEKTAESFFKWGVGPYIDGLFLQSNLGIVVKATFALAPTPERVEGFVFSLKKNTDLVETVDGIRIAMQKLGNALPVVQIQNSYRTLLRTPFSPKMRIPRPATVSDDLIQLSLAQASLTEWTVVGSLQGDARVVRAARKAIRKNFSAFSEDIFFFDEERLDTLRHVPGNFFSVSRWIRNLSALRSVMGLFIRRSSGRWTKNPFSTLKIKSGSDQRYDDETEEAPVSGLLFFPAVLPMVGKNVDGFAKEAASICKAHLIMPNMGFLNFSERCFFVGLPLPFDKDDPTKVKNAHKCYEALRAILPSYGGYIYRASTDTMDSTRDASDQFWRTAEKIKRALDPKNIIAPGRYIP
jgi:4-cresol dehydrogenase (hydroxylating)